MKVEQPLANYNGKPQIEDGYTKIANELLEAIILFKFTERQYKVFFAILRKTYGFNKTNDDISLSQLSAICNLPINHVSTVIKQLVSLNIIIKAEGKHAHNLRINKHYYKWGLHNMECHKMELHNMYKGVTSLGVLPLHNMEVQKKTPKDNTKENISTKEKKQKTTLKDYIFNCKQQGIRALPDDCIVFKNAEKLGIDNLWVAACWNEFKHRYFESGKKQSNWITTFNNCIKGNWFKAWGFNKDGVIFLTSEGHALVKLLEQEKNNG